MSLVHLMKSSLFGLGLKLLNCTLGFSIFQEILAKVRMKSGKGLHSETCEYDCGYAHRGESNSCGTFIAILLWWLFFSYVYQVCFWRYSPHAVHLLTRKILYPPHHNFARASCLFVHFLAGTA